MTDEKAIFTWKGSFLAASASSIFLVSQQKSFKSVPSKVVICFVIPISVAVTKQNMVGLAFTPDKKLFKGSSNYEVDEEMSSPFVSPALGQNVVGLTVKEHEKARTIGVLYPCATLLMTLPFSTFIHDHHDHTFVINRY